MDDDEDVLFEGSPVHRHLKDLGFTDMETEKPLNRQPLSLQRRKPTGETIDCDVIAEVLTLRAANLLFEDDLDHVDCIFANFELAKNEYFKFMFKGKSCAFVLALGLCFYVYMGGYAFVLVSIFYAYRTSDYLWKKRMRLKQLKDLMCSMQSNFTLLIRIIKFLYENEHMLKNRFGSKSRHKAMNFVSSLKADFINLQRDINAVLAEATITLIRKVPLCDYLESPECYISHNLGSYRHCESVTQLHSLYMLLQSQFLTRLIFSLIPNLLVHQKDDQYLAISDVVLKATVRFREVQSILNKKFKFALLNGIYLEKVKTARPLPPKLRQTSASQEMFLRNIHDLGNSLQYSLIKSRELQTSLETGADVDMDKELTTLHNELSSCQSHISDILILHKKYSNFSQKSSKENVATKIFGMKSSENIPVTELGYPDLDPHVEDDIFEATIEGKIEEPKEWQDSLDSADPMAKSRQKQMLDELKIRLKQQAENWAKREAIVAARKGIPAPQDIQDDFWVPEKDEFDDDDDESVCKRSQNLRKMYEETVNSCRKIEEDDKNQKKCKTTRYRYTGDYLPSEGATLFADALRKNLSTMPSSIMQEESFLGSGENSEEE